MLADRRYAAILVLCCLVCSVSLDLVRTTERPRIVAAVHSLSGVYYKWKAQKERNAYKFQSETSEKPVIIKVPLNYEFVKCPKGKRANANGECKTVFRRR
jgi:hypothetical protein